jgi:hypothetical protein
MLVDEIQDGYDVLNLCQEHEVWVVPRLCGGKAFPQPIVKGFLGFRDSVLFGREEHEGEFWPV